MPRWLFWTLAALYLLFASCAHAADMRMQDVDFSTPADQLPYAIACLNSTEIRPTSIQLALDVAKKGEYRFFRAENYLTENCSYNSSVMFYGDPLEQSYICQYNGPHQHAKIWSFHANDIVGDSSPDLLLTRTQADSVYFEILQLDSTGTLVRTRWMKAAIGDHVMSLGGWQAVAVEPLASIDLNGDGVKDLIYSRSAAPDSAFERGIIAYDLEHEKALWSFPTADPVTRDRFHVVYEKSGKPAFVFNTVSCGNSYESRNGMDSQHAYLLAVNAEGVELWRHTVGNASFYPTSVITSVLNDSLPKVFVTHRYSDNDASASITIDCYDVASGRLLKQSNRIPWLWATLFMLTDTLDHTTSLLASAAFAGNNCVTKLDASLKIARSVSGARLLACVDVNRDAHPELLLQTSKGQYALLTRDFELDGVSSGDLFNTLDPFGWKHASLISFDPEYMALAVQRHGRLSVAYARYKWHVVLLTSVLFVGTVVTRQVMRLYQSLQGVNTVDSVDSLVFVINRAGRIVFNNNNRLARHLLGEPLKRRAKYHDTDLRNYPDIIECLDRSFRDLFEVTQDQLEISLNGSQIRIWLTTYPRLDENQTFQGKIVFVEDLSTRSNFRKMILSETMQRLVHGMKTRLATVSYQIGNLKEDPALIDLSSRPALNSYLDSVSGQVDQMSETCKKILKYASIGKPQLVLSDVNLVIDLAIAAIKPRFCGPATNVPVTKMLESNLPRIWIDSEQIRDALENLLVNAVNAARDHGAVTVHSRQADVLLGSEISRFIEVVVEDTGIGMNGVDVDQLGTPGFSKSGSTGVGIALVKEIVKNHSGSITFTSKLHEGTTVVVKLPVKGEYR